MPDTKTTPELWQPAQKYKRYKLFIAASILVIFHLVGFWGLLFSSTPEYFQRLTPLNLLLTNTILFYFHHRWSSTFILFTVVVFLVGFISEVLGVHTGMIFGNYTYGEALGVKVWDVPLMIGLNWLMLVYTTGIISNHPSILWPARAVIAAVLMVILDFFIEPVAMTFDFWSWQHNVIPFTNYIGWFGIALVLQFYFQKSTFLKVNVIAPYVYILQLFFFLGIYIIL